VTRVLAIFLDGYEHALGQRLMSAGEMPEMTRLAGSSAQFLLNYGAAQRTGLAGEHVSTGLSPEDARRWSAVHFDPQSYDVWQEGTRLKPFPAELDARTVVFDMPYFDLRAASTVNGIVGWGAHDPGVPLTARPVDLSSDMGRKFGPYPATPWIYGFAWPSARKSSEMGQYLARAVDVRAEAAHWLLSKRFPDWDLALVAVSESHSVIEPSWHGLDSTHPLHHLPGAPGARASVHAVYHAIDRLVGKLTSAFPDAATVVFAMGGMGANQSDLPSMLLLPELMYRRTFKASLFTQPREWPWSDKGGPILLSDADMWTKRIAEGFQPPRQHLSRALATQMPKRVSALIRKASARARIRPHPERISLNWMPAVAYQPFWHAMPVFALPSYYDGRIRVNLKGRESCGLVEPADYQQVLSEVAKTVRESRDPATGESVVDFVESMAPHDPRELEETQADMVFVWKGTASSFEHPTLGRIGPVPYRRTGGHTGASGMAYVHAQWLPAGERGMRSAFDVVPTLLDLLGCSRTASVSGASLLSANPTA
jgi:hypothetical protein